MLKNIFLIKENQLLGIFDLAKILKHQKNKHIWFIKNNVHFKIRFELFRFNPYLPQAVYFFRLFYFGHAN